MKGKIYQPPSCEGADHLCDGAPGHVGQQYVFRTWITCDRAAVAFPYHRDRGVCSGADVILPCTSKAPTITFLLKFRL